MEFETGRRSTLARLQLSVQGLAGSLNSAKKVLVASTVLTAAFCGAIFGLTLVANEASKESHVTNGLLTTVDGDVVKTQVNKGTTYLTQLSAEEIAKQDFVSFSQDGADRYMQILGVQATASKKVINTIVGAFEVTEEGMTFAGDNVVLEATEADKAARKAQCKFCANGRNAACSMCTNGRAFAVAGRNTMCAVCNNGRNFQCTVCSNGRNAKCMVCANGGRNNQCRICSNGRSGQCVMCTNGRNTKCSFCSNGRRAQAPEETPCPAEWHADQEVEDSDTYGNACDTLASTTLAADISWQGCGSASSFDAFTDDEGNVLGGVVDINESANTILVGDLTLCDPESRDPACYGESPP